jgi:hypothetical protein
VNLIIMVCLIVVMNYYGGFNCRDGFQRHVMMDSHGGFDCHGGPS